MADQRDSRIMFIGLGAADPALIDEWAGMGALPSLRALRASAAAFTVENPPGLFVGSIWPSFYTGNSPARHKRYCWRQLRGGTYDDEFFQVDQIRGEPFWDTLDRHGKRTLVIDIPKAR